MSLRLSLPLMLSLSFGFAACDPYECFPRTCADGTTEYDNCISCYGDIEISCTVQTRTPAGDEIDECDYESDAIDTSARDSCFAQVEAAACP